MHLKVILQWGEDGKVVARVPALRGCWSQGENRAMALENVREAIAGWLEAQQDKAEGDREAGEVELMDV